ncbi:MAG: hypothetical protein IKR84_03870 [Oscillibacter sp.]|nr:hypothetical protein [Oscillibacter sp.]
MNYQLEQELRNNPELLRQIMNSRDGQTLMKLLTQSDRGARLRHAAQLAADGNPAEMADCLRQVTQTREGAALITRLQRLMERGGGGGYGGV